MLEVAGEVADGVYAMVGVQADVVERTYVHVATGAKRAGRTLDDLAIAHGVPVYMGDTREAALEGMRAYAYSNVSKPRKVFATVMRELHPELRVPDNAADLAMGDLELIADALGIVGTPVECGERLSAFVAASGVGHIVCRILYADAGPLAALAALTSDVLPPIQPKALNPESGR
jgi:5,10-methylenetetrahydromethanopterin reductase